MIKNIRWWAVAGCCMLAADGAMAQPQAPARATADIAVLFRHISARPLTPVRTSSTTSINNCYTQRIYLKIQSPPQVYLKVTFNHKFLVN